MPRGSLAQVLHTEEQQLSVTDAQYLLEHQGYEIACRFGHVHARRDAQK